jgi:hypothetical protein
MLEPIIGCQPERLVAYADAMERLTTDLLGAATHLARQLDTFVTSCRELPLGIDPGLADPLAALARTAAIHVRNAWLTSASQREISAQDTLNFIATVIDQSPLADTDRAEQNWQAWLHLWQARELRAETLQTAVAEAEDELRRAEAAFQVAVLTHQPAAQSDALQQTIDRLRAPCWRPRRRRAGPGAVGGA